MLYMVRKTRSFMDIGLAMLSGPAALTTASSVVDLIHMHESLMLIYS